MSKQLTPIKIDMHTHIIPKSLPDFTKKFGYGDFITLEHHREGYANMMKGNSFFREINENCWNPELRIKEYDHFQTQYQVICTIPVLFSYWAKPQDGLEVSRFLNDDIAETIAAHPDHYLGLCTVPMQEVDLAIKELERCKKNGFYGAQIGSNINGVNLSDSKFFPFYEACEQMGMSLLVHPWEMMGQDQMSKYWLPWLVGMPAETARAIASMIFSGVFDMYPELRVCFAHAGGSFIPTIGRLEHGFNCRPDLVAIDNATNPREYLGRFWIDSITHDEKLLEYVIDAVGSDKICLGSDYPFPLGDLEIGKFIEEMGLDQNDLTNIMYKSTLEWLGINDDVLEK
jgi:aminocarboxymuconate-semialdehyde decarboxylase